MARRLTVSKIVAAAPAWSLALFLVMTFAMGGGARSDIQSLAILRPLSAVALAYALWGIRIADFSGFRVLLGLAALIVALVVLHLIPVPPSLWSALSGRDLIVAVDSAAGLGPVWRPLSLAPSETANALYSLIGPMAVFLMLLRVTREQRYDYLSLLLVIGLVSGFLGLLQGIGPESGPLYFYNITNGSAAVGLFANRNHQAVFLACLFPMLAVYASTGAQSIEQAQFRRLLAISAGLLLIPLLLVTGSRGGLIVGFVGLIAATILYDAPSFSAAPKRKIHRVNPNYMYAAVGIFGFTAITLLMSRAQALERLLNNDGREDERSIVWGPIVDMAEKYFPFGSGIGSFVEAYQIDEPFSTLSPEYLNHAHNDWLEVAMTGGLPAILIVLAAVVAWIWQTQRLFRFKPASRRAALFGKLGAALIFMLALGSVVDYPLRVPSVAAFFVIAAVWMSAAFDAKREYGTTSDQKMSKRLLND